MNFELQVTTCRMYFKTEECSEKRWCESSLTYLQHGCCLSRVTFVGWVTTRLGASGSVSAGCNPSGCTSSEESKLHCCTHSPPIPLLSLDGSHQQWANPVNRHFCSAYKEPSVLKARKEINKSLLLFHTSSPPPWSPGSESPPLFCISALHPNCLCLDPATAALGNCAITVLRKCFFSSSSVLLVHNWNGCLIWFCHLQNCSH